MPASEAQRRQFTETSVCDLTLRVRAPVFPESCGPTGRGDAGVDAGCRPGVLPH
jgi:hypothetical protein